MFKKYFVQTYGCQMNERDSEYIAGTLESMGYSKAEEIEEADVIMFNTCCIREKAENKALSAIGQLKKLKECRPEVVVGVAGCMTQQEGAPSRIRSSLHFVDLIIGTHNLHQLEDMIKMVLAGNSPQISVWEKPEDVVEGLPDRRAFKHKSLINITFGCNNFCTYCIVPYVRGRERSRKPEDIIDEIKRKVADGVVEVMLLGQNVNSYGKDFEDMNYFLADLINDLEKIDGLKRIRYMTSHPRDFTDSLLEAIKNSTKVTDHFHLPIQSGSNSILKKMNRGYTREYYLDLVKKVREIRPDAVITTDIIIGFPGETESDFQDTVSLVKEVRFDSAYTFMYSPRKGTPAATYEGQISLDEKKRRIHELNKVVNKLTDENNMRFQDMVTEVLVEDHYKNAKNEYICKTSGGKSVIIKSDEDIIGSILKIKITQASTHQMIGEIL